MNLAVCSGDVTQGDDVGFVVVCREERSRCRSAWVWHWQMKYVEGC